MNEIKKDVDHFKIHTKINIYIRLSNKFSLPGLQKSIRNKLWYKQLYFVTFKLKFLSFKFLFIYLFTHCNACVYSSACKSEYLVILFINLPLQKQIAILFSVLILTFYFCVFCHCYFRQSIIYTPPTRGGDTYSRLETTAQRMPLVNIIYFTIRCSLH